MKLTIDIKPIVLTITVLEIQRDILPSFKATVSLSIAHPTGKILYNADDIWFEYEDFKIFYASVEKYMLRKGDKLLLKDMSEYLLLLIEYENNKSHLSIKIKEPDTGMGEMDFEFSLRLGDFSIENIYSDVSRFMENLSLEA